MDEPTAALGVTQSRQVLDLVRRVRDAGQSVILISHSLPDVFAVADRLAIMRLGRRVAVPGRTSATSMPEVVAIMVGAIDLERGHAIGRRRRVASRVEHVLGIDIGTSSCKATLLDPDGVAVSAVSREPTASSRLSRTGPSRTPVVWRVQPSRGIRRVRAAA